MRELSVSLPNPYSLRQRLTRHALDQMDRRSIPMQAVQTVLAFGRRVYTRGAEIYVLGRKETQHFGRRELHLVRYEGIHVVCHRDAGILTVYRNRQLKRLRPTHRARRRAAA